jgi:hypothetical protein
MFVVANPVLAQQYERTRPITDPNPRLINEVRSYPTVFGESSTAILCGRALGARLVQLGVQSFNPNAYSDVLNRFGGGALGEFTPQVAQSLNQNATYFATLGQELTWLSQVLPAAAEGNWGPYLSTGTSTMYRQMMRQNLVYLNQMAQISETNPQLQATFNMMLNATIGISPYIEQQIVVLALTNVGGPAS